MNELQHPEAVDDEQGIRIVLSTHDLDAAAELADRVCVMHEGNDIGGGTPQQVFYDKDLLARANLQAPTPVRIARDLALDEDRRPVTESELVELLSAADGPTTVSGGPSFDQGPPLARSSQ